MEKRVEKMEAKKEQNKMKMLFAGAAVSLLATNSFATTTTTGGDESFGDLFTVFEGWLEGNLGKLLALLGFAGTFLVYMMTHKGSVLFIGIVISLIAGGMVGISQTFFGAGTSAFN
jgi:hypothetical protein